MSRTRFLLAALTFVVGLSLGSSGRVAEALQVLTSYNAQQIEIRTGTDQYNLTSAVAAASQTFTRQSKAILVVNEGSNPARVTLDGTTATSTAGILLNAGASYSDTYIGNAISHIRTGGADTTLRVYVTF